jgi:glycosyltransferase involved in cell wall biosynthesis
LFRKLWYRRYARLFRGYDIISAHSIACGRLALAIHKLYKTPFYVTWHGSDIHTLPYTNKYNKIDTVNVLEKATGNFFVSKTLMKEANKLSKKAPKYVLYNGVGSQFYRYTDERRAQLREEFKVHNQKVVAFIGNLFPIKNVLLLPNIFKKVSEIYKGEVVFWIVGDGKLRAPLASLLQENNVKCVLWGNQPVDRMPDFMNAIDVLVLPSKNEGLPLVTVEALACGANVVGSNVGGIAEVIDNDNVFELDAEFETNISNRIVEMLRTPIQQSLSSVFNWDATASLENNIYSMELSK